MTEHGLNMKSWWEKLKPAASARSHLLLAGLVWACVGAVLAYFGMRWIRGSTASGFALTAGGAVVLGLLKARYVLARTANRIVTRIKARGNGRCLGGVISWRMWGFVLCMIILGRVLRRVGLPLRVVGFVYLAVGLALLTASRHLWSAWFRVLGEADA